MKIIKLALMFAVLLITSPSFAHAGHDHSSIMASLVHLFWLAPVLIAVAIFYTKLLKKNYQIKPKKKA